MTGSVIAIDGPSASGKSTTARAVAERLGFAHLDSGALYRGVTLVALREAEHVGRAGGPPLEAVDPETILRTAEEWGLRLHPDGHGFAAYLQGEPVDDAIRGPEVTAHVSAISAVPVVREWVNSRLRAMVRAGMHVVVDGRDIGTVVFPDAELKVYLTATVRARAGRRLTERGLPAGAGYVEREAALLSARDHADSTRAVAPLRRATDAVDVDTTNLDFGEQVALIVALARPRLGLSDPKS
ncbi:MAG TPA: (d)CMP kinase [Gemmatimonadales bacterium]|nr:(d)CMP kinase [Gemmatimonadales bacterium]